MPPLAQATCGGDTAPHLPVGGGVRGCELTRVKFASKKALPFEDGKAVCLPPPLLATSVERAKKVPDNLADLIFVVSLFLDPTPLEFYFVHNYPMFITNDNTS